MLKAMLEAMTGSRKRVIAVIPAADLAEIREIKKARFMNLKKTESAVAQSFFNFLQTVSADRLAEIPDVVATEAKAFFVASERSIQLNKEFDFLLNQEQRLVSELLSSRGIEFRKGISLDSVTGEVEEEVNIG